MSIARLLLPVVLVVASLFAPVQAFAESGAIAIVDFQKALNEVAEGKSASTRLESMFSQKRAAIQDMENNLRALTAEYEKQQIILSNTARAEKEQDIMGAQRAYQVAAMQAEQEMQQAYGVLMEELITKMRLLCEEIGKEKGLGLVLEVTEGGVVYTGNAQDLTAELIKRYDAKNPG